MATSYVLEMDAECGVPMCIYWDTEKIADWICEMGYPQYRVCIEKNFVAGRHLIYLNASTLPEIGITDFEHIKDIAGNIRGLLGLDHMKMDTNNVMSNPMTAYMEIKRRTGLKSQNTYFKQFFKKHKRWFQ